MREFKFRAWASGTMLFRELFDRNWYNADDKQVRPALPKDKQLFRVMQSTGLKDKDDVDIYEGDIVGDKYGQWQIKFSVASFVAVPITALDFRGHPAHSKPMSHMGIHSKILGNIYENPELVREAK